ncbi:hypothetical protein BKA70DRAFT_1265635, partial [Coprinopsis sp. MPI-PUGE-AT-0042]
MQQSTTTTRQAEDEQPRPQAHMTTAKTDESQSKVKAARLRGGGAGKDCFFAVLGCFLCFECCEGCCECIADCICCPCEM